MRLSQENSFRIFGPREFDARQGLFPYQGAGAEAVCYWFNHQCSMVETGEVGVGVEVAWGGRVGVGVRVGNGASVGEGVRVEVARGDRQTRKDTWSRKKEEKPFWLPETTLSKVIEWLAPSA